MKKPSIGVFVLGVIALILFPVGERLRAETFTNTKGVTLEGEIRAYDTEAKTVTLHVPAHNRDFTIPLIGLDEKSQAKILEWHEASIPKAAQAADWVKPGASQNLTFGELGNCNHDESPLNCNVYVPTKYTADRPVPLLVWLTGGKGGNALGGAWALAGKDEFVCASLPFPSFEGRDIFARQKDKGLVEFWEVHRTMLDRVAEAIPNLDPNIRIIAGFSNGAHSIGGYCSQAGEEFGEYFNVFKFGDGGVYTSDWPKRAFRDAHAYCCWGEESNNKDMGKFTSDACEDARMILTTSEMADTGHKFTPEEKVKVKTWLMETVLPERRKAAAAAE